MSGRNKLVVVSVVLIAFFVSCENPGNVGVVSGEYELMAPENVTADFNTETNSVDIFWNCEEEGVNYEILRLTGSEESLITTDALNQKHFSDQGFPLDTNMTYKVRAVMPQASASSDWSQTRTLEVGQVEIKVNNLTASVLEFSDRIRLSWKQIVNGNMVPVYEVFRYSRPDDPNPQTLALSFSSDASGIVTAEDTTAEASTTWYYLVKWYDSVSGSYGLDSEMVPGIFVSSGDEKFSEPNDDYMNLPYEGTFPAMTDLFIFRQGELKDTDCFQISIVPSSYEEIGVRVDFLPEFNGKIGYEFIYNGAVISSGQLFTGTTVRQVKTVFSNPGSTLSEKVYFRMYPLQDLECTYSITYINSL